MDEAARSLLEELRTDVETETGEGVAHLEILPEPVADAVGSGSERVDAIRSTLVALIEDEKAAMARDRCSSGVRTDEEDVDRVLYGRLSS